MLAPNDLTPILTGAAIPTRGAGQSRDNVSAAVVITDELRPKIRGPVKDDWAYIFDSYKKSYRELGPEQYVPRHFYWPEVTARLESFKANPAVEFRVAVDPEDSDFIWGWAIIEAKTIVHYVFVRASAQGQGVASLLLADVPRPINATHWTSSAEGIACNKPGALLYRPSLRRGKK